MLVSSTKIRTLRDRLCSPAALGAALAAFYLSAALAEDATPQSGGPCTQLDEGLVTAQRRELKRLGNPISVWVIEWGASLPVRMVNLSALGLELPRITCNRANKSQ